VTIDAPRERVFEYLQDIANHPEFTDHFLVDWRLTRESSIGAGAGARFRAKAPFNRFAWGDVTFAEVLRPRRIVEVGSTGKTNRIRTVGVYELLEGPGGTTKVSFTYQSTPAKLSDRISEALGGRWWLGRQQRRALRRLRGLMEGERGAAGPPSGTGAGASSGGRAAQRVTVAGG
jgi:uncharacterized protein YndB with AHSA1/START domain